MSINSEIEKTYHQLYNAFLVWEKDRQQMAFLFEDKTAFEITVQACDWFFHDLKDMFLRNSVVYLYALTENLDNHLKAYEKALKESELSDRNLHFTSDTGVSHLIAITISNSELREQCSSRFESTKECIQEVTALMRPLVEFHNMAEPLRNTVFAHSNLQQFREGRASGSISWDAINNAATALFNVYAFFFECVLHTHLVREINLARHNRLVRLFKLGLVVERDYWQRLEAGESDLEKHIAGLIDFVDYNSCRLLNKPEIE